MVVKCRKIQPFSNGKFIWDINDKIIQVLRLLPDKMYGPLRFYYG
jgi:hypothetical protein